MIREIEEKDFSSIYKLGTLLHENYENIYNLKELRNNNYTKTYVFEENKKILGFVMFTKLDDIIDIIDLVVDTESRRKKIATNLLDRIITNAKRADKIYLEVNINNQAAISLYEKFGFKKIHIRKKYYKNDDAIVMERVWEDE